MVGLATAYAGAQRVFACRILPFCEDASAVEAANCQPEVAVQADLRVLNSVHLNHTAQLPAGFRRNPGGKNAERLDVVSLNLRPQTWKRLSVRGIPSTTNCV